MSLKRCHQLRDATPEGSLRAHLTSLMTWAMTSLMRWLSSLASALPKQWAVDEWLRSSVKSVLKTSHRRVWLVWDRIGTKQRQNNVFVWHAFDFILRFYLVLNSGGKPYGSWAESGLRWELSSRGNSPLRARNFRFCDTVIILLWWPHPHQSSACGTASESLTVTDFDRFVGL